MTSTLDRPPGTPHDPDGFGEFALAMRYAESAGRVHLTGIQALVRMILQRRWVDRAAGRRTAAYVSGYEGSPLAGLDLELARNARLLADLDIVHRPGLNEELAATAVSGTQLAAEVARARYDGVSGFWYGKAPGLDRASDALRHANLTGTAPTGGAVALVGDDPSAKSSSVPCTSAYTLSDLSMPTLVPCDQAEVLSFGLHAVELSRVSGLWTGLNVATSVADGSSTVDLDVPTVFSRPDLSGSELGAKAYSHRPNARLLGPDLAALEASQFTVRLPLAAEYIRRSDLNRIIGRGPARLGIVAAGTSFADLCTALRLIGLDPQDLDGTGIRLLKLGAIHPFDDEIVARFADGLDEIVVVENKRPFLEDAVKSSLYSVAARPLVLGKHDVDSRPLFGMPGELDAVAIATGLARRMDARLDSEAARRFVPTRSVPRTMLTLAEKRVPYFCSGCPHSVSTRTSADTLVGGGIGCHAMVLFMDPADVGQVIGISQMGGEGAQWIGMSPFVEQQHFVQNLGDGTFVHSGSLAVRAAVAAGVDMTFKLLHNSAVAMTGGQHAEGDLPLDRLVPLLYSEGVREVVVTSDAPAALRRRLGRGVTVLDRSELPAVEERLSHVEGVTVLIHDQECAAQKRRRRHRGTEAPTRTRVMINERVCEGCGDCGAKSNCLSLHTVATDFGPKTTVDQSSCNLDTSCLKGDCPSFVTVTLPEQRTVPRQRVFDAGTAVPPAAPDRFDADHFRMRITGVGGTGVVTVAQILSVAALLDGHHTRGLDQTGLAQKGGAVVSDIIVTAGAVPDAPRMSDGACDLYLGCDALVAADDTYLRVADAARTIGLVSTSEVPTGPMVTHRDSVFPSPGRVTGSVAAAVTELHTLDALDLSERLLGDEQYANMVMVGAALQIGALPISERSIRRAVELNGVAVQANLAALRLGRVAIAGGLAGPAAQQEAAVPVDGRAAALVAARTSFDTAADPGRLVGRRTGELIDYQDQTYAAAYLDLVERVRASEQRLGAEAVFTTAVATGLFTLMAYKDEYEVARLSLLPGLAEQVREQFGADATFAYRLHPPMLKALGMNRKIALGRWFDPAFATLRTLRRLRGTAFDPFGHTEVRRTERALIAEYREAIERISPRLTGSNRSIAVEIAELPQLVRGYEDVKMAGVTRFRDRMAQLLADFERA